MLLVESELLTLGAIVMVLMVFAIVSLCVPDRPGGEFANPILLSDEQRSLLQAVVIGERKRKSALNRSRRRAAGMAQAENFGGELKAEKSLGGGSSPKRDF